MSERDPAAHPPGEHEAAAQDAPAGESPSGDESTPERDDGPVRRPLIRATLKLADGVAPLPRPVHVFTMHQQPRGGSGSKRGNTRSWNGRPTRDDTAHPNKTNGKPRSGRSRSGSRRDKGRSR